MDYLYYLFAVLAFLAVVLFLEGAYMAWNAYKGPEAKRIERRLEAMTLGKEHESTLVKQRVLAKSPGIASFLQKFPRINQIDKVLLQSGLNYSVARFLGVCLILATAGFLVAMLFGLNFKVAVVIAAVLACLPFLYMLSAKQKRIATIEQQLPSSLDLMGRAMVAGHAFPSALQMVGTEMPEPIASEFRIVFDEINYGIPTSEALMNLIQRVPSTDVSYFVIAVLIQRETGGNLAELLGNISELIRARLKLLGTVRVLSAEGRLSAWILTLLPFVLGAVLQLVNPEFVSVLWTDPNGLRMVVIALILMVFGIFVMWRIIKIRV
ncbi:pilus assembly protein TadB [Methylotenera oryzisoli]|uniref:Pilus assembly protein TadB n=1 Tax=Methylotenera oryzisoli TaxID=2080758 RepID=A0A4Y9VUR2_9PROT|nr:type II secretion system F family protein [Methylotenera oryzisoli]TFW73078.1 pilus assembly protein TadB [Methylotenera oryzisoli]